MLDHRMRLVAAELADDTQQDRPWLRSGRGELDLALADIGFDVVQIFQEIVIPGDAAIFAVGDRLEPSRFLLADDTLDLVILDLGQRLRGNFAAFALFARFFKRGRSKQAADMINKAISDIPSDMTITMHLCRGNFRSSFVASGGYEPVAELLFNQINVHGYFMEYDSDRAGGFEPLRFVPKGKMVVLGLVTTKTGTLEKKDELKRRIEEAAKFVDIDQLCLSPQCGFASTEEGNTLAEDEEWAKLRMIAEIAREVWGE